MATIRRSAVVGAAPQALWRTVSDPRRLPEWWPDVERVEGVDRFGHTEVMRSSRGTVVRADYRRTARDEPRSLSWEQRIEGTPFEKVFASRSVHVTLDPAGDGGTLVELAVEQRFNGAARFVRALNGGGVKRRLDAALAGLAAIHEQG